MQLVSTSTKSIRNLLIFVLSPSYQRCLTATRSLACLRRDLAVLPIALIWIRDAWRYPRHLSRTG